MIKAFFRIRYMTILAVIVGLLGAALLLLTGAFAVVEAFGLFSAW